MTAGKLSKGEKLVAVDHSTISYPPFRKNFYIEVTELSRMGEAELAELRKELDGALGSCQHVTVTFMVCSVWVTWGQGGLAELRKELDGASGIGQHTSCSLSMLRDPSG